MSIFSDILRKIFPPDHPAASAITSPGSPSPGATATAPTTHPPSSAPVGTGPVVDVEQILNGLAQKNPEKLNWRTSIVDLLKLLGLDSSITARKNLAQELQYTGDTNDSASMNMWLHKGVMKKLAENGGRVPDSLKH